MSKNIKISMAQMIALYPSDAQKLGSRQCCFLELRKKKKFVYKCMHLKL